VYLFMLRGFYAHQDTRTPFVINVGENLLNIVLAIWLVDRYGVLGLGLAFAIAYVVGSAWALNVLSYKVPGFPVGEVLSSVWRLVIAAALAGEAAWFVGRAVGGNVGLEAVVRVAAASLAGLAVYAAVLIALRAPEVDALRRRLSVRPSTRAG